jgi:hypothetical protein
MKRFFFFATWHSSAIIFYNMIANMNYWKGELEMLYEKTNDIIYELSCLSVNMLLVHKKEEVIPELQNKIKKLSGLFVDLKNNDARQ